MKLHVPRHLRNRHLLILDAVGQDPVEHLPDPRDRQAEADLDRQYFSSRSRGRKPTSSMITSPALRYRFARSRAGGIAASALSTCMRSSRTK